MCMCGNGGTCGRCHAGMMIIVGALLLLNAYVWPKWLGIDGWVMFAGVLLVLKGILSWLKPTCPHWEMPSKKK